jgi:hypothetical protein
MKFPPPFFRSGRAAAPAPPGGFTLPELLIASTVFMLLVGGIVAANLFGLRMYEITEAKLNATDGARKTIGKLTDEIRRSRSLLVGNVHNGVFEALLDGQPQQGSSLLIHPTTNTADYVIYFVNPADETLRRTTSVSGTTSLLAEAVTNAAVFQSQDFSGNVLTNNRNNRVIHVNLEFYQPQRPLVPANYYKLETSVKQRVSNP